ncbi:TetR family transcriptional regulator, partial [Shigella sonnei]|uniref:TetR/AcrR family transcriptional regulator n=1 Tax=Shigella sonnei TaxID=624 RepID=UPI00149439C6
FDHVTVDEIASAADVGRMTVFNHFPRKEDMFFDREEEGHEMLRDALQRREPGITPVETLRLLAHRLAAEDGPYLRFSVR